ncbi:MAG: PEP-CTERM system TPR-repeat protein PrsT, partial [Burkholderiales bacterium]
ALLLKGDLELADRKLAPARALYEKVADLSPTDLETRAKLVSLAIELNDLDGAKKRHEELRKLAPGAPGTHYLNALIHARQNKLEPAREAVQQALRLAPDYMPAVSLAAGLSLSANALEQAERHARMMVERTPENPMGYRVLGATYLRMNAPDRALEAVRPALGRTPPDPVLLSIAGEASLKLNQPAAAAGYFERASKFDPEDARARTGLGLSHLASGQSASGIGELEQAVALDSANVQADIALVMAHLRERQYDKALAAVGRLEKKEPKNPVSASLRGAVLSARGDIKGARSAFEQALALDPAYFPAAANLAAFDLRDNRPGDARQRYRSVLAKDPKNSQAAVAVALLTAHTGGPREQVLDELKQAREANPEAVLPILATARYLIETGAPKDAIPMLQEAANRNTENTQILDVLATGFVRSGQRAQAISTWEKILRLDPKAVLAQVRIGEAQLAGGDLEAALASFRKAAAIAPQAVEPQVGMAAVLHQQGKKDEAMRIAARMRANDKQKVAGAVLEGDLLAADGDWAEASDRYRGAFAQQRSLQIGVKAHRALRTAKRDAEAETFLRDWVRAEPANLRLRLYAGEADTVRERWKQAFEHYAVVLEKEPKNALALNNAAWALHELKDARALDHARRAYEAAPKSASIVDTYGVILSAAGDPKGLGLLRQAVDIAPANPQIRLHLAEALARANDKAGAKAQIDELLKATPAGPTADSARALQAKL